MRRADRLLVLVAGLLIAVYFFCLLRPSFHVYYFSPDDTTNLYGPWVLPVRALVRANLLFFISSPLYRPFAAAWYGTIFRLAGFNPFPFHATYFVILLINVFWTYAVVRRLSGSREIAAITALVMSYNPRMSFLPAQVGEVLIAKAIHLGATTPPVPEDKPFPPRPLLPVASAIMVRVNGRPAEVALQIGWPGMVDTYRVDFLVPQGISPGLAKMEPTAGGATGPAVRIPLQ